MAAMRIGEVARVAGTGAETIRFYERAGLLPRPPRSRSGYRQYSVGTLARLRFIVHARTLGFSLREIHELLALCCAPDKSCADVRQHTVKKIAQIDGRIATLVSMKQALQRISASCTGSGPASACPIVDALEMESWCDER